MDKNDFIEAQGRLGWTNVRMAVELCKSPQSVSNYRRGRQAIPDLVAQTVRNAVTRHVSAATADHAVKF